MYYLLIKVKNSKKLKFRNLFSRKNKEIKKDRNVWQQFEN